jgi:hypothetical protein
MNDYTKNISQSIFTPGVFKITSKTFDLSREKLERSQELSNKLKTISYANN